MREPLPPYRTGIEPAWLDYNDHLNVGFYMRIFDLAAVALFDLVGMGEAHSLETGASWVVLESHVTYDREIRLGDEVEVQSRFIDFDAKRLHLFQKMRIVGGDGGLSSTCEQMTLSFDLNHRRPAPFPPHAIARIEMIAAEHAKLPPPEGLGRLIGIRRK